MLDNLKILYKNSTKEAKVVFFSILAAFLLIIIISLVNLLIPKNDYLDSPIEITNFSEQLNIPEKYKSLAQYQIWQTIQDKEIDVSQKYEAKIRENPISRQNNEYIFLVDIEQLHYSFKISFTWSEELEKLSYYNFYLSISCPIKEEIIYSETKCPVGTPLDQLKANLPKQSISFANSEFSISIRKYADFQKYANEQYVAVAINSCGDKNILNAGKEEFTKWLKSIPLDPNDFHIEYLDSCIKN